MKKLARVIMTVTTVTASFIAFFQSESRIAKYVYDFKIRKERERERDR